MIVTQIFNSCIIGIWDFMGKKLTLAFNVIFIIAIIYVISLFYAANNSQIVYTKSPKETEGILTTLPEQTEIPNENNVASSTAATTNIRNYHSIASSTISKKTHVTETKTETKHNDTVFKTEIRSDYENLDEEIIEDIKMTNNKTLSWGIYPGPVPESIEDFEKIITANPDYLAHFVHWGNGEGNLPSWLSKYAYDKGRTLVIFWEASDYLIGGTNQPKFSYKTILNGNHDAYIVSFAEQIKDYKGPVILIPFSELNGNWTPWSGTKNGNTPEEAVLAFRYVHGFFNNVPNVKFALAINAASLPNTYENRIEAYYPGHEYVDYVGIDGFNMGNPWESFSDIFSNPLNTLSKYNKPIFLFSFASAQGEQKNEWLNDALNVQMPKYPLLKGFIYFNQNKERNWLLWSDNETLSVFTDYVSR